MINHVDSYTQGEQFHSAYKRYHSTETCFLCNLLFFPFAIGYFFAVFGGFGVDKLLEWKHSEQVKLFFCTVKVFVYDNVCKEC